MKLLICLVVVLCVAESFSEPLLARRRLYGNRRCMKGGILGILFGNECDTSQHVYSRSYSEDVAAAPAAAAASAAAPSVNVNVQNTYNNQDNRRIARNDHVGRVNNNAVNNDVKVRQKIRNSAESNVRNDERVDNRRVNNNYRGNEEPCEDC